MAGQDSLEIAPQIKDHLKNQFQYEVVSFVSTGSTCLVYKLIDSKSGAFLAAKVVDRNKLSPLVLEQLLPNELKIVREVSHPYIIRVNTVFSLPGFSVIVSEFASDGDFISHIERSTSPNLVLAKKWFHQVVQALVYLHSKGIVSI